MYTQSFQGWEKHVSIMLNIFVPADTKAYVCQHKGYV